MRQFVRAITIGVVAAGTGWTFPAAQGSAPQPQLPSGATVAREVNARHVGQSVSRTVVMELTDANGRTRRRATRSFRKDYGGETRTVIFFTSPPSVEGTALLTYDYADARREDDQWLYVPALRRVRRLSSANRLESFLGSDFSYDDIRRETRIDDGRYLLVTLGVEKIDACECYVVEASPAPGAGEVGFSRIRHWIEPGRWMPRRAEYWDTKGRPAKTIEVADIRQVQGIWTAHRFEAINHRTGHRTTLRVDNVNYEARLDDDLFTEAGLRRGF